MTILHARPFQVRLQEDLPSGSEFVPAADRRQRVLVVDDEKIMLEILSYMLSCAGYPVVSAAGGLEAVEILRKESFDLVITDLNMPGLNGWTLTEFIKERSPETPVILITGSIDSEVQRKDRPFDAVLFKPFTAKELVKTIDRVLTVAPVHREKRYGNQL